MSMRCELTGKSFQTGNNVSHAKNRTKRRFKPNLQNITFVSEALGQKFQLKVAASTIRTVEKKVDWMNSSSIHQTLNCP